LLAASFVGASANVEGKTMANEHTYSVMAATRAFIRPDETTIEVQLATREGPVHLLMTPNTLGQIASGLTELETAVQTQIAGTTGHAAIPASDVSDVHLDASADGEKILIVFRNSKGRRQAFALSLDQSQRVRVDAKKAEEKARKLASQSRN
jgi:hypothetical protein